MSDDCKCGIDCVCHTLGEGGHSASIQGEAGKIPYVKECKCNKKCIEEEKPLDEN